MRITRRDGRGSFVNPTNIQLSCPYAELARWTETDRIPKLKVGSFTTNYYNPLKKCLETIGTEAEWYQGRFRKIPFTRAIQTSFSLFSIVYNIQKVREYVMSETIKEPYKIVVSIIMICEFLLVREKTRDMDLYSIVETELVPFYKTLAQQIQQQEISKRSIAIM